MTTATPQDASTEKADTLCLPQSGLMLDGDTLYHKRVTVDDQTLQLTTPLHEAPTTSQFDLSDIDDMRLVRTWQPGVMVGVIPLGALAVAAKLYIPWEALSWIVAVALIAFALLPLSVIRSRCLKIKTPTGSVKYPLIDAVEDCDGFVAAMRQRWERH